MPILMEEPVKYFADIDAGRILRYGAILKDAGTGQIVGHLKETGQMAELLSTIARSSLSMSTNLNPLSFSVDVIGHTINGIQIRGVQKSVNQIQETLEGLKLATNVAALSSLAGLGVSVAGFALVSNKLNKIESKLDDVADDVVTIKKVLNKLHQGWDAMSNAKLQRAAETILVAEQSSTSSRRLELAKEAVSDFAILRHYYSNLLQAEGIYENINLDVSHLHELMARYTFTCLGVLQAEFMTGDIGSYRKRLETILLEFPRLMAIDARELYVSRCDQLEALSLDHDYKMHSASLIELSRFSSETIARIESNKVELEYLEKNDISAEEYLAVLRNHETDIVLLPR